MDQSFYCDRVEISVIGYLPAQVSPETLFILHLRREANVELT